MLFIYSDTQLKRRDREHGMELAAKEELIRRLQENLDHSRQEVHALKQQALFYQVSKILSLIKPGTPIHVISFMNGAVNSLLSALCSFECLYQH